MSAFTLSLDCEGLWGMADNEKLVKSRCISQQSLAKAYAFILSTLRQNELKATAAFVTCFAVNPQLVKDNISLIEEMALLNPDWFGHILPAVKTMAMDGWTGAEFYRSMLNAGHEMAWHGTTHMPLSEKTSSEAIALELELASRLFCDLEMIPKTIIFPRNQIGHLEELRNYGFETYRSSSLSGAGKRVAGLLNEWNILDKGTADKPCFREGWNISPAGNFLNWPSGVRAAVPVAVTVRRWKSLLRHAALNNGYVHMWFHPHNLITAPAMQSAFQEIMCFVGQLVKSGDMVSLTMTEANEYYKAGQLR